MLIFPCRLGHWFLPVSFSSVGMRAIAGVGAAGLDDFAGAGEIGIQGDLPFSGVAVRNSRTEPCFLHCSCPSAHVHAADRLVPRNECRHFFNSSLRTQFPPEGHITIDGLEFAGVAHLPCGGLPPGREPVRRPSPGPSTRPPCHRSRYFGCNRRRATCMCRFAAVCGLSGTSKAVDKPSSEQARQQFGHDVRYADRPKPIAWPRIQMMWLPQTTGSAEYDLLRQRCSTPSGNAGDEERVTCKPACAACAVHRQAAIGATNTTLDRSTLRSSGQVHFMAFHG